jgi:integrase
VASILKRGDSWRAFVRKQGYAPQSQSFPTKALAKIWADRIEMEMAESRARGLVVNQTTIAELVDWYQRDVGKMKRVSKTQKGNLTRIREGLGPVVASKLTVAQIVEFVRKRRQGEHLNGKGVKVPACGPATMTVEVGYLAELFKLATSMGKVTLESDVVAEARPALRLVKMVAKSAKRDRRPTAGELQQLREHFAAAAWRAVIPMVDIVDFAIASSRRQSEITRLLWADVDEAKRTCVVRDAKHPRAKAGNHRTFPLLGAAWEIVQRQPKTAAEIFPYNSKSIGAAFTRACADLRIDDLHFHDLRHEATSRFFEQGYSIEQVAAVTLHESWQELKRYTQLRPESLHRESFGGQNPV